MLRRITQGGKRKLCIAKHSVWLLLWRRLRRSRASASHSHAAGRFKVPPSIVLPVTRRLQLDAPVAPACWTRDTRASTNAIVQQTLSNAPAWSPARVALVLDGSQGMDAPLARLPEVLAALPDGVELDVWSVLDVPSPAPALRAHTPLRGNDRASLVRLAGRPGAGGRCNLADLTRAWDDLDGRSAAALVWLHGPQPHPATSVEDFKRRIERSAPNMRFYDVQMLNGPSRISEELDGVPKTRTLPPADALTQGAAALAWRSHLPDRPMMLRGWLLAAAAMLAQRCACTPL